MEKYNGDILRISPFRPLTKEVSGLFFMQKEEKRGIIEIGKRREEQRDAGRRKKQTEKNGVGDHR